jgi:hypothetical protein
MPRSIELKHECNKGVNLVHVQLRTVALPAQASSADQPRIPTAEYARACDALYAAAVSDWVVIYGDREHAANLSYLCGFDPRFEEALLVLGRDARRVLIVGNEGLGYAGVAPLKLEIALAQSLSLMGQTRAQAPRLAAVLHAIGIAEGHQVAVVGWKYLEPEETEDLAAPAFVPALLVDCLRRLVGQSGRLGDATALLLHPSEGLKAQNSAARIAAAEWSAVRAAEAVLRIVRGARPGMTELEAAGLMQYQGDPLSCHVMLSSGRGPIVGLRSPSGRQLAVGDGVTTAVGFRGGLCCRAGLLAAQVDQAFQHDIITPYFRAVATWWQTLRIGITGDAIQRAVLASLEGAAFAPALNPGHLIAEDEWMHTPIRPGSAEHIMSGMLFQCDIIPAPLPDGYALNCEDTVAVADAALRATLAVEYPDLWQRVQIRRAFLRDALGLQIADELLPLSPAPAYLPPFWLQGDLVCTVADE